MNDGTLYQLSRVYKTDDGSTDICPICKSALLPEQWVYRVIRDKYPFRCEDAENQDWEVFEWHKVCDPGTIAAGLVVNKLRRDKR